MLLAGVYRPTHYTFDESDKRLFETIGIASESNSTLLIMGDFNLPDIRWPLCNFDADAYTLLHAQFIDMYVNSNLHQLIKNITRKRNNEESLLDLILCNEENFCTKVEHHPNIGSSDHQVLVATAQIRTQTTGKITTQQPRRNFFKADYEKIAQTLAEKSFIDTKVTDVEGAWTDFTTKTHNVINTHVPTKKTYKNYNANKPWINREVLDLAENKKRLWKQYILSGTNESYKIYRQANNHLTRIVRNLRMEFERGIVKCGPKSFYSYMRQQLSSTVSVPPSLKDERGHIASDQKMVADLFALQFEKSFVVEPTSSHIPRIQFPRVKNSIQSLVFTPDKVRKALNTFSDSTSMGPDALPSLLLKQCSHVLSSQLAQIMNLSLENGRLPQEWKVAHVTPIYKKGDKHLAANYRPISLTSIVCRTMEKIIAAELRAFMNIENIIIDEQHGFVSKRSIVSNLLMCLDKWTDNFDKHQPTDVIYLDYEKAFDRVPIKRLVAKLEHLGIRGQLLQWIEDFLTNRKFKVRVGETLSDTRNVHSGVPQGSVLGPLLFILFTTDLKSVIHSNLSIFADDTKIMGNPLVSHNIIQQDLDRIVQWTKDWLISLNASKCSVLHIGKNNPKHKYTINSVPLQPVDSQRDLGVIITHNLKWDEHITMITKKANSLLYIIRKAFYVINKELFLSIYLTYIRPLLEFAFQIWNPYLKKDIVMLERVQKRATKIVFSLKNMSYEERLLELNLPTLEQRRIRGDLIETYKILNHHYNVRDIESMFTMNTNTQLRGHSMKLNKLRCASNPRNHFLPNRVVQMWNSLPEPVISAPNVNIFKNRLDKHLKTQV